MNVPLFNQCDPSWADDQLGTCSTTMCAEGCAVTSSAMLYQYYGGTMNPGELNQCLTNNGGYDRGCLIYWENACMPSGLSWVRTSTDLDDIDGELAAGRPVIAQVHSASTSMHFVVVVGNDGGAFQINDPYWDYGTIADGGYTIDSLRLYSGQPQFTCDIQLSGQDATIIDDRDPCFVRHGSYWWEDASGYDGHHWYTYAVADARHDCWAQWTFAVQQAGTYDVEVYIPDAQADSRSARYTVTHSGTEDEVRLDQTDGSGWRYLGRFDFDSGDGQFVALHDNTGENLSDHIPVGFDAVRFTPVVEEESDGAVMEPDGSLVQDSGFLGDAGPDWDASEDASSDRVRRTVGGCTCRASGQDTGIWPLFIFLFMLLGRLLGRFRSRHP